ncbi:CPBP family intramembrane glutamic endopeptidase [Aeromicrobium sp. CTD01-1L150]|uniref:CPBP family intramembrane glutamic endopeptidase n=1 Tax=Aeromicrobium sp. CTD01-1L150 TaxID=3341830 RepID=UPI0035C174E3
MRFNDGAGSTSTPPTSGPSRRLIGVEVWIVLGLSLGQSAVYAVVSLVAQLTRGPLRDSIATLNSSRSDRQWLDLTYQLLGIGFAIVPVLLALYLLWRDDPKLVRGMGLTDARPVRAMSHGLLLAAVIGLPGIGVYFGGRALGVTAEILTVPENVYWWTIVILVLAALQNALLEEVVMVGYLFTRLGQLGWGRWQIIVTSAALRATYHLYQGFGQAVGNFVMGLVFGWWYLRTRRVLPLVIAHTVLDVFAFVGVLLVGRQLGLR